MTLVTNIDGQDRDLFLPLDASEWHFGKFCDFRAWENRFHLISRQVADGEAEAGQAERAMAEALEKVTGAAVHDLPTSLPGDDVVHLFNSNYRITLGTELSQTRVYAHLAGIAKECEPTKAEVLDKYPIDSLPDFLQVKTDGKTFKVVRDRVARVMSGKPLNTGEAIECQEYLRRHATEIGKIRGYEDPERASSLDYTLGLTQVAILLRRFGEQLPWDDGARERWLVRRRKLLRNIDLQTVQDIRFFYRRRLAEIRARRQYDFFTKSPPGRAMNSSASSRVSEGQRKHMRRMQAAAKQAWEVSGWRVFYQIGVEERWFEGLHLTPFQSVFYSDWRSFVGAYCLKMSRL
jgi:hypothetical protein